MTTRTAGRGRIPETLPQVKVNKTVLRQQEISLQHLTLSSSSMGALLTSASTQGRSGTGRAPETPPWYPRRCERYSMSMMRAQSRICSAVHVIGQDGVVCAAGGDQHSTPVVRFGMAFHITRATGRFGMGMMGFTASISCTMRRRRPPMSIRLTTDGLTGLALEDQTGGILLVHADAQRMGLDSRTGAGKASGRPRACVRRGCIP